MALSITTPAGPLSWIPSGNGVKFTISSTATNNSGFYFLIDVVINGTTVVTLRRYPITGNSIDLNLQEIVNSFIESNAAEIMSGGGGWSNPTDYCELYISVTEFYNGQTFDTTTTNPIYVWDAAADFEWEKENAFYTAYLTRFGAKFNFMVPSGAYSQIYKGHPMAYHGVTEGILFEAIPNTMRLTTLAKQSAYHFARGMNHKFAFLNGTMSSSKSYNNLYAVACGYNSEGLLIKKAYTYLMGASSYISGKVSTSTAQGWAYKSSDFADWNDCVYMSFYFASQAATALNNVDEIITIPVIMHLCDVDEYFAVTYKSKDGSWGIIQCNETAAESTSVKYITKEDLKPASLERISKMRSVVNVTGESVWTLNTDWVTSGVNEDIKDMLLSPIQYILHYKNGTIEYIPVVLSDSTYITKQYGNNVLFNYRFEFAESYYKNTIKQ